MAYSKSYIYDEIIFYYFTITPITKSEQEIGFVSPFYNAISFIPLLNFTSENKNQVSIEMNENKGILLKRHLITLYRRVTENQDETAFFAI